MIKRRETREVNVGKLRLGGINPIIIQSMTNTDTRNVEKTSEQINALTAAGAGIVRFSVYDVSCAEAIKKIRDMTTAALVADIHFDHKLAIMSAENGIDKLRINPGNIGSAENVRRVSDAAKAHGIPIRIGINSGSVEKDLLNKYGGPTPQALVDSAMRHVKILEDVGFYDIVISLKASNVVSTVEACRIMSKTVDYPLHIGVTESGLDEEGLVKSAIGIGSLLLDGIGDTLRVSLTGDPVKEVHAAKLILRSVGLIDDHTEIISCPTCGRTTGDLESVVRMLKSKLDTDTPRKNKLTIAVMGCVVNGPGEAREADIGIAFAPKGACVFVKGEVAYSGERETVLNRFVDDCIALQKAE